MKIPNRLLCKRSLIIGDNRYMLIKNDWYTVIYTDNDTEETFSVIDNNGNPHLFYIYEDEKNHNLPRTYSKWFYTPSELEIKNKRMKNSLVEDFKKLIENETNREILELCMDSLKSSNIDNTNEPKLYVHDIRNKLSPITNLISLLERDDVPKDFILESIKSSKESINYLTQREVYEK